MTASLEKATVLPDQTSLPLPTLFTHFSPFLLPDIQCTYHFSLVWFTEVFLDIHPLFL